MLSKPGVGKVILGSLFDVKFHAFATNNQSILLGNKVAWISKILMRLVFGTKSCGFFLNSRFSLLTIRILPRVGFTTKLLDLIRLVMNAMISVDFESNNFERFQPILSDFNRF